ncbi:MAG: hypothetical protein EYC70_08645 [Planctomycetota bacterium]|nr:MAG: hypothetical protein EYC70_08645 [Planctomycetota bacterium]
MAEERKEGANTGEPAAPAAPRGLYSTTWFSPSGRMKLVNGIWVAEAPEERPASSSARAGTRKPRTMREKLELEAAAKESQHHGHPAA